jgi:hypothetical protein
MALVDDLDARHHGMASAGRRGAAAGGAAGALAACLGSGFDFRNDKSPLLPPLSQARRTIIL